MPKRKNILRRHLRSIGDREIEGRCYGNLETLFNSLGDYVKAKEYLEKELAIAVEIGHRQREGRCYGNLGAVFSSLSDYVKAHEYLEKALEIAVEIGDREEGICYRNLGAVLSSLGDYISAREYYEKAIAIAIKIGDREGEETCYGNLGGVLSSLGDYAKAKEYHEKALAIAIETGDRKGEGRYYRNLGAVFSSLGDYVKAKEYQEKALAIAIETGDRKGEGARYENLGAVFSSLGDYVQAKEYHEKALAIAIEIGYGKLKSHSQLHLGVMLLSLGIKYADANKFFREALLTATETGDRSCEAQCYQWLGNLFNRLGDPSKANEYFEKALAISVEIGDRLHESAICVDLGTMFISKDDYTQAEEYLEKALLISKEFLDFQFDVLFSCYNGFTQAMIPQEKYQEAFPYLFQIIQKCEDCRGFLKDNDEFKVLYSDRYNRPYKTLSKLFVVTGNPKKSLYVEELGRAKALSDLMAAQYAVGGQISVDPQSCQSWTGIENVLNLESDSTCLYISYDAQEILMWILKASGAVEIRRYKVDKKTLVTKDATSLDTFFYNMAKSFRSFGILPPEVCEDRSFTGIEPTPGSSQEENLAVLRQG